MLVTAAAMRGFVMSVFNRAAAKKAEAPKAKAKGVAWLAGDPAGDQVAKSVKELVRLDAELKAIEARMGLHKATVKKYAEEKYLRDFADRGVSPDTPMTVQTTDGERVTYVVQDRSGQYAVREEQLDALGQLLGLDAAGELTYREATFRFNRDVMALPGVQDAIGAALDSVLNGLVESGVLTKDQSDALVDCDEKVSFKPGTLDRLPHIVGRDVGRMRAFLEIAGSSVTRYVKA